jgi:speckle-type POZ protein
MAEHCKISAALVAEERSYVLKLDGYSRTKALVKTGECVTSAPFSVGGHTWAVKYYPNGKQCAENISVYLVLDPAGTKDVKAKLTISVLDKNGEPVPSFSRTIPTRTFSRGVQKTLTNGGMIPPLAIRC